MLRTVARVAVCTLALAGALPAQAQNFGPGNVVVYRVGDGIGALAGTGNPVFLDEFTPSGALVRSVALPTTVSGNNRQCVAAGIATSEGYLTRTVNGEFLVAPCYGSNIPALASLSGTTGAAVPRVVARIAADASIDSSTALADFASGNAPRGAASTDGVALWVSGASGGVRAATLGATSSTQLASAPTNLRNVAIFNGQLYVSTASGSTRLASVGSGLPITSGQTIANLPGLPVTGTSPNGFVLLDLDAGIAGVDTLYVADDGANSVPPALSKFSLVGGSWVLNGSISPATGQYRGLTATVSGGTVTLYATRGGNELVSVSDSSGYNGAFASTPTLLATAGALSAFRGVALAPISSAPTSPTGTGSATPALLPANGSTSSSLRVVVTPGTNPVSSGITVNVDLSALGGSATAALRDDGAGCDGTAGDNDFCTTTTAALSTPPGPYTLTFAIADAQARSGSGGIALTVEATGTPTLSIGSLSVNTGQLGQQLANLPVSLSPSSPVAVTFSASTGGGTATPGTGAPADYAPLSAASFTIPANTSSIDVPVTVFANLRPTATRSVDVSIATSAPGVVLGTSIATLTIDNNAPAATAIWSIQGLGAVSPLAGQTVNSADNIVTAVVGNGFVMQARAPGDVNPASSDAIFVFTGAAPGVAVGDVVDVRGRVGDFVSASGARALNATQFFNSSPALIVSRLGSANVATATQAIILDDVLPSPSPTLPACTALGGAFAQPVDPRAPNFACFEYMRVTTIGGVITAPNQRFGSDTLAEMGFTTGGRRAFREPGVAFAVANEDPILANLVPAAPNLTALVWDGNPELFEFDPDRLGLPNAAIVPGSVLSASGVIGIDFADYEFWPSAYNVTAAAPALPRAVPVSAADQLAIGTLNLLNLFDLCDDPTRPNSGETFNVADTNRKLEKLSRYIRESLRAPAVLAVQEAEQPSAPSIVCNNVGGTPTSALALLATRISADGGPTYVPIYGPLTNDPRFIAVGFLYRSDAGLGAINTTQLGAAESWNFRYLDGNSPPQSQTRNSLLHDRPPLQLEFTTPLVGGASQRFALLANHFRSLGGIDDLRDSRSGGSALADPTFRQDAHRVRQKRLRQAVSVACMVQQFQSNPANANVPLIALGDHNAFEFSDGYTDVNGIIAGRLDPSLAQYLPGYFPPAELPCAPQTNGQYVSPGLEDALLGLPPAERYSFNFALNAQALDHALLSQSAIARFERVAFARGNADAPSNDELNPASPLRASDHDGMVLNFNLSTTRPGNSGFLIFADGFE